MIAVDHINVHITNILAEKSEKETGEKVDAYSTCHWNTTAAACDITYKEL